MDVAISASRREGRGRRAASAAVEAAPGLAHGRRPALGGATSVALRDGASRNTIRVGAAAGDEPRLPAGGLCRTTDDVAATLPGEGAVPNRLLRDVRDAADVAPVVGRARAVALRRRLRAHGGDLIMVVGSRSALAPVLGSTGGGVARLCDADRSGDREDERQA